MLHSAKLVLAGLVLFTSFAWAEQQEGHHGEKAAHSGKSLESGANLNLLPPPEPNKNVTTRPGPVVLEAPVAFEKVSGGQATLKWKDSAGADSYHYQVATDPNFKWLVTEGTFYKGTTLDVKGLEAGKQYFWRVAGMKSGNWPEYQKGNFTFSSFTAQ